MNEPKKILIITGAAPCVLEDIAAFTVLDMAVEMDRLKKKGQWSEFHEWAKKRDAFTDPTRRIISWIEDKPRFVELVKEFENR